MSARQIGRYAMHGALASGGMATVYLGRLAGAAGFSRTVAIKSLRPQYAEDADFVSMFIDEARVAARIRHPNVVPTLDVVSSENELFSVLEYVHGETLSRLIRASHEPMPLPIASAILRDVLHGLHAAHEATDENGHSLEVVHRDVSPQNVIVGIDGIARVLDFGVAKAAGRIQTTREGQLKGKLAYMAPEQFDGVASRATDVFAASIVLWEAIVRARLFAGDEAMIVGQILRGAVVAPSTKRPDVPAALDAVVMRGLAHDAKDRYATAHEMADALEQAIPPATTAQVGAWVSENAAQVLDKRQNLIREMESAPNLSRPAITIPDVPVHDGTATDLSRDTGRRPAHRSRLMIWIGAGVVTLIAATFVTVHAITPMRTATSSDAPNVSAALVAVPSAVPTPSATVSVMPAKTTPPITPAKPTSAPTHRKDVITAAPDHI